VFLSVLGFAFLGPIAALVLVAVLLDHEFAHRFMMRRLGYMPGPVRIVPLLGAYVRAGRPLLRSADIALIYLAGPLAGIVSAELATILAAETLSGPIAHQVFVGAAMSVGLNLANLLPVEPLDGGLVSRILPYPALLIFPLIVGAWLVYAQLITTPLGMLALYSAVLVAIYKVNKWRRYVANLRSRLEQGDVTALGELQATFLVPMWERVFVVCAYGITVVGGIGFLLGMIHTMGWIA
jgi:Zn-dependent protease